ncbi:MAG TPA: hypothetical protein VMI31_16820 [Fimbriimonadaceae bacterium]|nr:hypothetical protein [Fimbriimonadaceae bacterium]
MNRIRQGLLKCWWLIAMATGLVVAAWALVEPVAAAPVVLLGIPDDFGTVNGNRPVTVRVGVLNLRPSSARVETVAAGCSNEQPRESIPAFGIAWIDFPIEMRRFPLGPQFQVLAVHGDRSGHEFVAQARFHVTVRRDEARR